MGKVLSLEPEKYILKEDQGLPEEQRTIFHIRPLNFTERAEIQDAAVTTELAWAGPKTQSGAATMRHHGGQQGKMAIMRGLTKIENLLDINNKPIPYDEKSTEANKVNVLNQLSPEACNEIAKRILVISGLQKEEEKN